jgi:hypothetical protein
MADKETSPADTREQATRIKQAWTNLDAAKTYGGISMTEFSEAIAQLDAVTASIQQLEDQLRSARNKHRSARHDLWNLVKRTRTGALAQHGEDSDEYERFGGTRESERQRRRSNSKILV